MQFLKPSIAVAIPPLLLVVLAALDPLIVRLTVFAVLAIPLQPLIHELGWVYRDKPIFLTYKAALLTSVVWALVLYVALCGIRRLLTLRNARAQRRA